MFEFLGVDPDFNHPRFEQERHQTSGKTRATRLAVRLEKLGRSRAAAGCRRTSGSCSTTGCRCGADQAPRRARPLPPETLAELRADAERLRELTGRDFSNWKIWDAP